MENQVLDDYVNSKWRTKRNENLIERLAREKEIIIIKVKAQAKAKLKSSRCKYYRFHSSKIKHTSTQQEWSQELKKHNIFFSQFSSQSEQDLTEYTFINRIPEQFSSQSEQDLTEYTFSQKKVALFSKKKAAPR